MHANHREEIESVSAGDIAAAVGLKNTTTGDTLCVEDKPIVLESITFPSRSSSPAVEPKTKADQDKMSIALQRLAEEDPTFQHRRGGAQTRIAGMGEPAPRGDRRPHAARVQGAGQRRPAAGRYREAIRKEAKAEGRFVRQTGGRASTATPSSPSSRSSAARASSSSRRSWAAPCRASSGGPSSRASAMRSPVASSPGIPDRPQGDPHRRLVPRGRLVRDGVQDRRQHGRQGWCGQGRSGILEPVMKVDVTTPEDFMGDVIGNLNARAAISTGSTSTAPPASSAPCAPGRDVRLRHRAAQHDPGPRHVLDGVQPLRRSPNSIANELIAKSKS